MKKTMLKSQKITLIVLAVAVVIMAILYFTVLAPMLAGNDSAEEAPELINEGDVHGEVLGPQNRILLFEQVKKENIQELEVHNSFGSYTFYRGKDGELYIKDSEATPYNLVMLSSMVTSAGYTLSMLRVTEKCEDFSIYGLAEEDEPAWYTLTTTSGIKHTVYIGDMITTGAGYYVRYADRDAVYILESSLGITLLNSINSFVTPLLTIPIEENEYYSITDFYIERNGEKLVHINAMSEEEQKSNASISTFKMIYPGDYVPSSANYEMNILPSLADFQGTGVVVLGTVSEAISAEKMAEYGIDLQNAAYHLHFVYQSILNDVYFSEYNEEKGCYYAYSVLFNTIVQVAADKVEFLKWDFINFVDRSIFLMHIDNIKSIRLASGSFDKTFLLTGEGDALSVKLKDSGETVDTVNFRQLYKVLLSTKLEDYADYTSETLDTLDYKADITTLEITTKTGVVYDYKFYPYHTRRALYTINGDGEFFVLRDQVDKMISDAQKVIDGVDVDSYAKN